MRLHLRMVYQIVIIAVFLAVALYRSDLVIQEFDFARQRMAGDWDEQLHTIFLFLLMLLILVIATAVISLKTTVIFDLAVVLTGLAIGYMVEAWGTRYGLWSYYTNEKPPLWIIPVWPLGALLTDRVNTIWGNIFSNHCHRATVTRCYWFVAISFLAIIVIFTLPASSNPATYIGILLLGITLTYRPQPETYFPLLIIAAILVLPADYWGTASDCWHYYSYPTNNMLSIDTGVAFGIAFDAVVVLSILRVSKKIETRLCNESGRLSSR
ncbi:MAG: hypothetical protein HOM55_10795 [Proteobacteria bacterium]|jgi:hypothetical protein|nr:hypothetical protein [Pseudomonadota bacterium]